MPVSPEEIASKSFSTVSGWGYERGSVDAFLSDVAVDYRAAVEAATVADAADAYDRVGEEVASVLRSANKWARNLRCSAQEEADITEQRASEKAQSLLVSAERQSAAASSHALQWCQGLVADAKRAAEEIVRETERRIAGLSDQRTSRQERLWRLRRQMIECIDSLETAMAALGAERHSHRDVDDDEDGTSGRRLKRVVAQRRPGD